MKKIKGWTIKCSSDSIILRAFEEKDDASEELEIVGKLAKKYGFICTHRIIPCEIRISVK